MPEAIQKKTEEAMAKAVAALEREFKRLRTGRATPGLVDNVRVNYYGSETPLAQVASIAAPEPRLLIIKPFDAAVLVEIEKALVKSDLGINPQNDGKVIRLNIPALNEETRKKLVQDTRKILEHAKVAVRSARRDGIKEVEDLCKQKKISEDIRDRYKDILQELTKKYESKLDGQQKSKEEELLKV